VKKVYYDNERKKEKEESTLEIVRYSDIPKKKLTAKEREKAIKEISASIKKTFSKKYLQDGLKCLLLQIPILLLVR